MLAERVKEWTREWKEEGFQQGRQEGLQKGRQEGRQEGIQLGEAAILLRLIEIKVGPLSDAERQKIQAADVNTLLQWSERILTADTKEDVFK